MENIVFPAYIVKIQTMMDGGLRVTLDLPESAIREMALLAECKRWGITGMVTFAPDQEQVNASGH